ncbi:hypothetical protein B0H17DRAFT_1207342 [Mycena rosella]|uniref:Uncharacterized protein n=1 Tax=Mycena rosella TaxID=1033263 RepID=A0AAD7D318_MYCRO|nr:hypothetical protein B0H17DRAFT_1207342 [Mycena rosella]
MSAGLYHEALWTSPTMSEGTHQLVITQIVAQSGGVLYLDYLTYDTTSAAGPYFIDDSDSRITYTPAWTKFDATQNDFQHTSQESTSQGDSLTFEFEGTGVQFYGGITPAGAGVMKASSVLDGGTPVLYTAPEQPPASVNNLIFEAHKLSDGTHKLVVTAASDSPLWADYFLVTPGTPSSPGPPPVTTPGSSGSTSTSPGVPGGTRTTVSSGTASVTSGTHSVKSGTSTTSASSSAPSSVSSGAPDSASSNSSNTILPSSSKSSPVAPIVAAILGSLLLIALVLGAIFFVRRRKRNRSRNAAHPPMANVLTPRPFADFRTTSSSSSRAPLNYTYAALAASTPNLESSSESTSSTPASSGSRKRAQEARRQQEEDERRQQEQQSQHQATSSAIVSPPATLSGATSVTGMARLYADAPPPQYSA